jgi:transcriptional regulator with XRE-family HTH domain
MENTLEKIRIKRKKLDIKQEEIAEKLGVSQNHYSAIETGKSRLYADQLAIIAQTLHSTPNDFLTDTDTVDLATASKMELITIPVFDADACAGNGWSHDYEVEVIENVSLSLDDVGPISAYEEKRPFAVIVKGDSMAEAGLRAGDRVCINPAAEVRDGEAALVVYGLDRIAALKWVYYHRDGSVELRSASTLYPPRRFTEEELRGEEFCFEIAGTVMLYFGKPRRGL